VDPNVGLGLAIFAEDTQFIALLSVSEVDLAQFIAALMQIDINALEEVKVQIILAVHLSNLSINAHINPSQSWRNSEF